MSPCLDYSAPAPTKLLQLEVYPLTLTDAASVFVTQDSQVTLLFCHNDYMLILAVLLCTL